MAQEKEFQHWTVDMDNNKFENFTKLVNQIIKINHPEPIFPRILND